VGRGDWINKRLSDVWNSVNYLALADLVNMNGVVQEREEKGVFIIVGATGVKLASAPCVVAVREEVDPPQRCECSRWRM
jgi:hypothetical protein